MDTFEKIRALLAEQLDIDPAKITMESDIMSDFEADSLDIETEEALQLYLSAIEQSDEDMRIFYVIGYEELAVPYIKKCMEANRYRALLSPVTRKNTH